MPGPNFPFHQAAQADYAFACLRATVRAKHDPCYEANRARAQEAGLLTGAYHYLYLYPNRSPSEQAAADRSQLLAVDFYRLQVKVAS